MAEFAMKQAFQPILPDCAGGRTKRAVEEAKHSVCIIAYKLTYNKQLNAF
jgi:hypothetical protein